MIDNEDKIIFIKDENESFKAADSFYEEKKSSDIEDLNEQISYQESGVALLERAREEIISINKQFEKCSDVYASSVKGVQTNQFIESLMYENDVELKKINIRIDERKKELNSTIKLLNEKKSELEMQARGGNVNES